MEFKKYLLMLFIIISKCASSYSPLPWRSTNFEPNEILVNFMNCGKILKVDKPLVQGNYILGLQNDFTLKLYNKKNDDVLWSSNCFFNISKESKYRIENFHLLFSESELSFYHKGVMVHRLAHFKFNNAFKFVVLKENQYNRKWGLVVFDEEGKMLWGRFGDYYDSSYFKYTPIHFLIPGSYLDSTSTSFIPRDLVSKKYQSITNGRETIYMDGNSIKLEYIENGKIITKTLYDKNFNMVYANKFGFGYANSEIFCIDTCYSVFSKYLFMEPPVHGTKSHDGFGENFDSNYILNDRFKLIYVDSPYSYEKCGLKGFNFTNHFFI